jgi:hypothetical protein
VLPEFDVVSIPPEIIAILSIEEVSIGEAELAWGSSELKQIEHIIYLL